MLHKPRTAFSVGSGPLAVTSSSILTPTTSGSNQFITHSMSIGGLSEGSFAIVMVANIDGVTKLKRVHVAGNILTENYNTGNNGALLACFSGGVPLNGTSTALSPVPVVFEWEGVPSTPGRAVVWFVDRLSNKGPRDIASSFTTVGTSRSVDLITVPGGFITACAFNDVVAAQNCTWSGDQSPTEIGETTATQRLSMANTLLTNDDQANTVTTTWDVVSTTNLGLLAASWR